VLNASPFHPPCSRDFIAHREIECSEDFEVLEIVAPADFATHNVAAPKETAAA
jgi:hypothetical protein